MRNVPLQKKFACCPEPWVLLEASLVVRRKPLYYIVNLVVPATVITVVAVIGFFTPATTNNERLDKLGLGIDSLLAMSFLMTMIDEKMPVTSEYVPLFGFNASRKPKIALEDGKSAYACNREGLTGVTEERA
uniref:Neurotransmitter-gated ion-channel transmembrane domain-containing protein n=1 Tax=Parascaris univalens TaxID=6257 RepID=A0A915BL59_PARUN